MRDISSEINNRLPFKGRYGLAEIQDLSSDALNILNDDEKQELEAFTNLRRQKEYVTSRVTIKKTADALGVQDMKILKDHLGQPYGVAESQNYFVSIAHTSKTVFCGISSESAIGIDLEPIDRSVPDKLKPRILHPNEVQHVANIETIRLWTIKEAYIKLRGQGLRMNMNQIQLQVSEDELWVELDNENRAKICSFQIDSHWLAIAYYQ